MIRYIYCKLTDKKYLFGGFGLGMIDGGIDGMLIFLLYVLFFI